MTPPVFSSSQSGHAPSGFPSSSTVGPASTAPASAHASPFASDPGRATTIAAPTATATPAQPPISAVASSSANPKVLPYLFDDAHIDDVLVLVVDMLDKLTEHNDALPLHPSALTRFHSRATPNISLSAYLRRIAKYTSIEKCCVLIILVYIDRVCERLEGFTICGLTVHRFICAAILCASKALCDAFNTNSHYAKVGGISLQEINLLEKEFLQIIDWKLTCSGALLQHYYASLVRSHKDYVLADEPNLLQSAATRSWLSVEMEPPNGHSSASTSAMTTTGSSGKIADSASGARSVSDVLHPGSHPGGAGSANVTPALGGGHSSSQHSSPFPLSSSGASPFTPSATNNAGAIAGAASGRRSSTSPVSAMQVDSESASLVPANRRRKDEQRTPPSPRSHPAKPMYNDSNSSNSGGNAGLGGVSFHGSGDAEASASLSSNHLEASKRTRFDHDQSRPPAPWSQQ